MCFLKMSSKNLLNLTVPGREKIQRENLRKYEIKIGKNKITSGHDEYHLGHDEKYYETRSVNKVDRNRLLKMFNLRIV